MICFAGGYHRLEGIIVRDNRPQRLFLENGSLQGQIAVKVKAEREPGLDNTLLSKSWTSPSECRQDGVAFGRAMPFE